MNQKFKRALAIFALVFVVIFAISSCMYFYNPDMFDGTLKFILAVSAALGLGTGVPLIILVNGQKKQERRLKMYEEMRLAEEEKAKKEAEEAAAKKAERSELDKKINAENNKK